MIQPLCDKDFYLHVLFLSHNIIITGATEAVPDTLTQPSSASGA